MALLTQKQAITKIYRLAKILAELNNGKLATTKTKIEFQLNECYSGQLFYMSKWDGDIMTIRPIFESQYIKFKIFMVENDKYIIDIK